MLRLFRNDSVHFYFFRCKDLLANTLFWRKMMNHLCFLLHVSRLGIELYTEPFNTRKALADHLRGMGLHFSNADLCRLGEASLRLYGRDGFIYEIEEIDPPTSTALNVDGRLFLPIADYCRSTGESRSTVQRRFRKREISGLTVGRSNKIYIYWRDSDE